MNDKPAKIEMVALKQLCAELRSTHARHARDFGSQCAMQRRTPNSRRVAEEFGCSKRSQNRAK